MVAFNFKPRFEAPIRTKVKRSTIRRDRKRNSRVGDSLQFSKGSRFKPQRFGYAVCIDAGKIKLDLAGDMVMMWLVSGALIIDQSTDLDRFAVADGFDDWADLKTFWKGEAEFWGWITCWGDTFVAAEEVS